METTTTITTTIFKNNAYQGQNYVKLLAQDMENRLEKVATILELTSMLPEVKNNPLRICLTKQ